MAFSAVRAQQLSLFSDDLADRRRRGPAFDTLVAIAFSAIVLYPTLTLSALANASPLTHAVFKTSVGPLVVVLMLIWLGGVLDIQPVPWRARLMAVTAVSYAAAMLLVGKLLSAERGSIPATTFLQITLLLPLAGAAGWVLVRGGRIVQYFSWLLVVGIVTVGFAVIEHVKSVKLLKSAPTLLPSDRGRAVVGVEHPLVLATLFVALIPVAMWLGGRLRYVLAAWLYLGSFMTVTSGPEIVGGLVLAVCFLPPLARLVLRRVEPLLLFLIAIGGFLVVGATWLWSTQSTTTDTSQASYDYREALYYLLPRIIARQPFGYGLDGLPANVWFVQTVGSGQLDVSHTIDSELVYAGSQFGVLGVLVFALIAVVAAFAAIRHQALGLTTLAVTLVGLFLAIHSWVSLGTFWFFCLGACVAVLAPGATLPPWTRLTGARRRRRRPRPPTTPVSPAPPTSPTAFVARHEDVDTTPLLEERVNL